MRLPNGYGSVYKLSGKRRNPWVARKTIGWKDDPERMKTFPIYQFIGYYHTRQEALQALSDYNRDPCEGLRDITLDDLFSRWSSDYFPSLSASLVKGYKCCWKVCLPIRNIKIKDLKLDHYQLIFDQSGKNFPTLRKLKTMLGMMYDYAIIHEICDKVKRDMIRYINIKDAPSPIQRKHIPFTEMEIKLLWDNAEDEVVRIILIMIYSGVRIGELLDLKKEDVHLDDKWFFVRKSKTEAGVREVPIADKVFPFIQNLMGNPSEYLLKAPEGSRMRYNYFKDVLWKGCMERLKIAHRPHDTRHTCITLMTQAGVDSRIIKKIVGHSGDVTESIYTHVSMKTKLEAINRI